MLPNLASAELLSSEKSIQKLEKKIEVNNPKNNNKAHLDLAESSTTKEQTTEKPFEKKIGKKQTRKNEAKILQGLDNLNQQSNNEIFLVESQSSKIKDTNKVELNSRKSQSDENTTSEDMMLNDSFEELDLTEIFSGHISVKAFEKIKGASNKAKAEVKYGVGVVGDEAVLINTLDNSDLMDFENEVDIWSKRVSKNNKKNKNR